LPAHTMYCSRIFCMYHVWLLSNIAAKIKPTWLIVNLVVSLKCSWLTVFKTQNWVNVAVRLKADVSFCYCDDVSAIYTLVVVRTTPQSAIVVGSTHCKHKQSSADEVKGQAITHFDCNDVARNHKFDYTRVCSLDWYSNQPCHLIAAML
jgi:hypothetical protein